MNHQNAMPDDRWVRASLLHKNGICGVSALKRQNLVAAAVGAY